MKQYGVRYNMNGALETATSQSLKHWSYLIDSDGRFGTDDINEAYQFMNDAISVYGEVYSVVEKAI